MKKIIIISFSDLKNDPRVNRQIRHLSKRFNVVTLGLKDPEIKGVTFIPVEHNRDSSFAGKIKNALMLKSRRFQAYFRKTYLLDRTRLYEQEYDLVLANDVDSLPLAFERDDGTPVICDCHEYAPLEFAHFFRWRIIYKPYKEFLCTRYLPRCRHVFTVSQGIAEAYKENYGILPTVITSASDYQDLTPSECKEDQIHLVHHGGAQIHRKIENMIEMMNYTDSRFIFNFMLVPGDMKYLQSLKKMAQGMSNVRFLPPLPMTETIKTINAFDIGVYIKPPVHLNSEMALPNKFFEFIQARLAVAVSPSPEMAAVVRKYDCGIVTADFSASTMANALNRLTAEKIRHYKHQSHGASRELSSEANMKHLDQVVDRVLSIKKFEE